MTSKDRVRIDAAVSCQQLQCSLSCREAEVKPARRISIHSHRKAVENIIPLVTSISRSLSILMLLLGSHRIPLLRLCVVSPSVVEESARVLYQLQSFGQRLGTIFWARKFDVYLHTSKYR